MDAKKKEAYRLGVMVLVGLAVLTVLEYFAALWTDGSASILFVIAIIKAWAIINYFMHVKLLWSKEGGH